ncbi:FHA domain-containing protein [Candidatus Woesearchaeota archaeon]|nr:FHA domain-containing protein [Candidatus Woesearchaeota archaeon]
MKLEFKGSKVLLEEIAKDTKPGSTNEQGKKVLIADVNRLFKGGFKVPLEGIEILVKFYESGNMAHYSTCSKVSEPRLEGTASEAVVKIDSDVAYTPSEGNFELYSFGVRELGEAVLEYLKQRAVDAGRQDMFHEVFGKLTERAALKKIVRFMILDSPRISTNHFMLYKKEGSLYVADKGSFVGTWVNGAKLGYDYGSWAHWDKLVPKEWVEKAQCTNSFDIKVDVLDAHGETIHGQGALYQVAREYVARTMNCGVSSPIEPGAVIAVGADVFKEESLAGRIFKRKVEKPHYEFVLREG